MMEQTMGPELGDDSGFVVVGQNYAGVEVRAVASKVDRSSVVFEIHAPVLPLQQSEALSSFQILFNGHSVYSGRGVVTRVIEVPPGWVCETALEDEWLDVTRLAIERPGLGLRADFQEYLRGSLQLRRVRDDFKLAVADLQVFLAGLHRRLEQVELCTRALPVDRRSETERSIVRDLEEPILPVLREHFSRFDYSCEKIEEELRALHSTYAKRQLHPMVLCAPFMYRTFRKPLGFAGDYEMVSMMFREPYEGGTLFAKLLNTYFLQTPPVVAHRNRIGQLQRLLNEEVLRVIRAGRQARIFNLGSGPAVEIQHFLAESNLAEQADFTLLDFDDETLEFAARVLGELKGRYSMPTSIRFVKKSVIQLLKEASKLASNPQGARYDLIYCAGLFDYLPDQVCERLMNLLYDMLAPAGLLVSTNVHPSNPSRGWMEYAVDWYLFYRDQTRMTRIQPHEAPGDACRIWAEMSGLNIFLTVRKPDYA